MTKGDASAFFRELGYEELLADLARERGAASVARLRTWFLDDLPSQLLRRPARRPRDEGMKPTIQFLSGLDEPAWLDPEQIDSARILETAYPILRRELLAVLEAQWPRYDKNRAGWTTYFFYDVFGRRNEAHVAACPETWKVLESIPRARNAYFSRLSAGADIVPHHGPTNASHVLHLPLVVPAGDLGLEVNGETRVWQEGKCLVFDDTYLHRAWNHTSEERVVLLLGVWNPQLTQLEREVIGTFGDKAKRLMQFMGKTTKAGQG